MTTSSDDWLVNNKLQKCHIFEALISNRQCSKNRKYYKKGLDKNWITIQNPVKYKKAVYCTFCNGLDSKENISPKNATIA